MNKLNVCESVNSYPREMCSLCSTQILLFELWKMSPFVGSESIPLARTKQERRPVPYHHLRPHPHTYGALTVYQALNQALHIAIALGPHNA